MLNLAGLTSEESELFIEVFEASLRINQREQLFSWLQGCFQYLFPHEVLLCAVKAGNQAAVQFETFISTRYMTDEHVVRVTRDDSALVMRAIAAWKLTHRPVLIGDGLLAGNFGIFTVPFIVAPQVLQESELKNMAAHGLCTGDVFTFFCFSRIPGQLSAKHAYLLELLVPHLHAVLIRISGMARARNFSHAMHTGRPVANKKTITRREREVMQWMNSGKTNLEIAAILDISPLTVKNHVHNILRKLGVENRSNACVKASQMGLLKI